MLKDKVDKEILDICEKGNNSNKLKMLLNIGDITEDFLENIIDISKNNTLEAILSNINMGMISNVFERINEDKHNMIVNKLYERNNILNETSGRLREMLEKKIKCELISAYQAGKEAYKKVLINTGIDVSVLDRVDRSRDKVVPNRVEVNVEKKVENKITLIDAILEGNEKKIALLKHSKDEINRVDENGKNAFMYAIEKGNRGLAKELLEKPELDVNAKDINGKSMLMYAIEKEEIDIIMVLTNRKVDVTARDKNGKSVLMYALERGESMASLIDQLIGDVSYEDKDKEGTNIFMYACQGGYMTAVKKLIEMIRENDKNNILNYENKGKTAISIAVERNNKELVDYLLNNDATNYGGLKGNKINKFMEWRGKHKTKVEKVSTEENKTREKTK